MQQLTPKPVKWDMYREVLLTSAILAAVGIMQSIWLLHHLQIRVLQLPLGQIQSGMFMQLVIAGHLLLFSTRAKGPFWKPPLPDRAKLVLGDHGDATVRRFDGRERMADSGDLRGG